MKTRYYWYVTGRSDGTFMHLCRNVILIDVPESTALEFGKYLLTALDTDFPAHHPDMCEEVLQNIARLERGEITETGWDGQGFIHSISPTHVTFEHTIFGECPEWPIWSCTLAQYKAALEGWKRFIAMPKNIDTELIVDMPD